MADEEDEEENLDDDKEEKAELKRLAAEIAAAKPTKGVRIELQAVERAYRTLYCFTLENPLRKYCIKLVEWKTFEHFILVTILCTCVSLGMNKPYPNNDSDDTNKLLEQIELIFMVIFTVECFSKIIAYGFCQPDDAYLKNTWNFIDFSIVMIGFLDILMASLDIEGMDVKALRAFRVLRPLRLVSGVPSLQVVLNAILMALVPLFHIFLLVLFVIIMYAIIGLEMFSGVMHKACFINETGKLASLEPRPCGHGHKCNEENDEVCREYWEGPNMGITNFDNFITSMLTVFQCITLEGWTEVLYWVQDSMGRTWQPFYFISLVVLGAFFVMNLILGVLSGEFSKERAKSVGKQVYQKKRIQQQFADDMKNYTDWLEFGEELYKARRKAKMAAAAAGSVVSIDIPDVPVEKGAVGVFMEKMDAFNAVWVPRARRAVKSQAMFWIVVTLVFLNSCVLASEHHGQPEWMAEFQETANAVFVMLFTFEMFLKMYALGNNVYFKALFNRFDCVVIIISVSEMFLTSNNIIPPIGLSVFRCLRLLRAFKVTRHWIPLKSLIKSLTNSIEAILSLLLLLFLFLGIFALLGAQLFGGKFRERLFPGETTLSKSRMNFDSFFNSLFSCFQVLTGEDWNTIMYDGIMAYGGPGIGLIASIYFIILFVFGNYILLNVFLAIAVDSLAGGGDTSIEVIKDDDEPDPTKVEIEGEERVEEEEGDDAASGSETKVSIEGEREEEDAECKYDEEGKEVKDVEEAEEREFNPMVDYEEREYVGTPPPDPRIPEGFSFYLLAPDNELRVKCFNFITNDTISNFLLICIMFSSVALAVEDPLDAKSKRNRVLVYFDYFFTTVFTLEITIKMIVYGVYQERGYLREFANMLDLLVVSVSIVSIIFSDSAGAISVLKILRVMRVLRPLRAISRAKGLKTVIDAVIVSVSSIQNIVMVTGLLQFMFAVIGVQLFKGKFYSCNDRSKTTEVDCQGEFISYLESDINRPVVQQREWVRFPFHYDNVPFGMLTLFVVQTFEGWPQILYASIDSFGEDAGPIYNNRPIVAFYYMIYIIILAFFMINIFVGFVIVTFQREGEAPFANCGLDKNQRSCVDYVLSSEPMRMYIPKARIQYKVWAFATSPFFEYLVFAAICINTLLLAMGFYNQPELYTFFLDVCNYIFSAFFTFEFIVKLAAFRPKEYFKDAWNTFDFVIVMGSFLDIGMAHLGDGGGASISMLRLFRAMRLVKLLAKGESIRTLLYTFIKSFQALPYVALLVALIFFIYGVVGMQVFGKIALNDDTAIHENNHFQSFLMSILVLFRCATGELWQDIMLSCISHPNVKCGDNTDEAGKPEGCGSNLAYPFFVTFFVVTSFIILNLFVAVIMDNFDYLTRDWSILGAHHLDEFINQWSEYDPDATGKVKHTDVVTLLRKINPPLGFGKLCSSRVACKRLVAMNMPMNDDATVNFHATLFAIVRTALNIKMEGSIDEANEELRMQLQDIYGKQARDEVLDKLIPRACEEVNKDAAVGKLYASILIQDFFRRFMKNKLKHEAAFGGKKADSGGVLVAGLRQFHEAGPEMQRTISGNLVEMQEADDPGVRRRLPFFGESGPYVNRRPVRPHDIELFDPDKRIHFEDEMDDGHRWMRSVSEVGDQFVQQTLVKEGFTPTGDKKSAKRELRRAAGMDQELFDIGVNTGTKMFKEEQIATRPSGNRDCYQHILAEDIEPLDLVNRGVGVQGSPPAKPKRGGKKKKL